VPAEVPGFCRVAALDEVREHKYALTPGRYVGAEAEEDDDEGFEEKMWRLVRQLGREMVESARLDEEILSNLAEIGYGQLLDGSFEEVRS
jgi:type I restriction enzyme M protein